VKALKIDLMTEPWIPGLRVSDSDPVELAKPFRSDPVQRPCSRCSEPTWLDQVIDVPAYIKGVPLICQWCVVDLFVEMPHDPNTKHYGARRPLPIVFPKKGIEGCALCLRGYAQMVVPHRHEKVLCLTNDGFAALHPLPRSRVGFPAARVTALVLRRGDATTSKRPVVD
jgi:hypothetical protein